MSYEPKFLTLQEMELICIEEGWPLTLAKLAYTGELSKMYCEEIKRPKKESFYDVINEIRNFEIAKENRQLATNQGA